MITNLQLLRGLAALGVVIYHTDVRITDAHSDLMGVAIFFVISGFIMVHITRQNADDFLARRLIRIVPLYWILTIASLLWFGFGFANPPYTYPLWADWLIHNRFALLKWFAGQARALMVVDTMTALGRSLSFWPTAQAPMPLLAVGWTLNIEMFFYLLFAGCLRIDRAKAPIFACAALVLLYWAEQTGLSANKVLATYGNDYVIFFVFGIALYYLWGSLQPFITSHRGIAVAASICTLAFWPVACFALPPFPLLLKIVPPSVVLALLVLHSANLRIRSQYMIDFGGASYSLYLIHIPVLETMRATATAFPVLRLNTPAGAVIAVLISCLTAMVSYSKLEVPLLRYLHSRFGSKTPCKIADKGQIEQSESGDVAASIAQAR